jgi:TPR repeat protein
MSITIAYLHKLRAAIIDNTNVDALLELQTLASSGISYAQYLLGEMYCYGEGVTVSYEEATKWLCLATDAGSPEAMITLAYFIDPYYVFANNVIEAKRSIKSQKLSDILHKTAFDIFIDRAKSGDIYVAKWLSTCYQMGWGVELDMEKSSEWDSKTPSSPYPTTEL